MGHKFTLLNTLRRIINLFNFDEEENNKQVFINRDNHTRNL